MDRGSYIPEYNGIRNRLIFPGATNGGLTRIDVTGAGEVYIDMLSGNNLWLSLSNLQWANPELTKVEPTLLSGWVNYNVTSYMRANWVNTDDGIVHVAGLVRSGTANTIFVEPSIGPGGGTINALFPIISNSVISRITVRPDGTVWWESSAGGSNAWVSLSGVSYDPGTDFTNASLSSGWTNYSSSWGLGGYKKTPSGIVCLRGLVTNTGGGSGTVICNLPAGYRPARPLIFASLCGSGLCQIDIRADGNVLFRSGNASSWASLWGINFYPGDLSIWPGLMMGHGWVKYDTNWQEGNIKRVGDTVLANGLIKGGSETYALRLPRRYPYSTEEIVVGNIIRISDFTEAMTLGNVERGARGLSTISWSSGTPVAGGPIRKPHIDDLRNIAGGLVKYASGDFSFTDSIVANVTKIRAIHMKEVRQVIDDGGSFMRCGAGCTSICGSTCSSLCYYNCFNYCNSGCSGSKCNTGCTDTCRGSCSNNCYSTCSSTCQSNCTINCHTTCNDCTALCRGSCETFCASSCALFCTNCGTDCTVDCYTGCSNRCLTSCISTCTANCQINCNTNCYTTCSTNCDINCYSNCTGDCSGGCDAACSHSCGDSCHVSCSTGCQGSCYSGCLGSCESGCDLSARQGVSP